MVATVNLDGVRGRLTVGRGRAGSRGYANASDGELGSVVNSLIHDLNAAGGGGVIEVLPGTYEIDEVIDLFHAGVELALSRGAVIVPRSTGAIGAIRVSADRCTVRGGKFRIPNGVASQVVVDFDGCLWSDARDLDFEVESSSVSPTTPMILLRFKDTVEGVSERVRVLPATGVMGIQQRGGSGNVHRDSFFTNGQDEHAGSNVVGRHSWICFQALDTRYCTLDNFRAWGIGAQLAEEAGITRPKAIIHFGSELTNAGAEDGHSMINSPRIELCNPDHYILLEGVMSWTEINNCSLGLSNWGLAQLGNAAIKITKNSADRRSQRIAINGGTIHNVARPRNIAQTVYLLREGSNSVALEQSVQVTGATKTYTKASGNWTTTPNAGDWINVGTYSNAGNNGWKRVASATSNTIVVEGPALTDETATVTITGAAPFDGAAVWVEHASDVDIRGLRIVDQRHMWGIVVDPESTRGIVIDSPTFAKASGSHEGAAAPIRIATSTLVDKGTALDAVEGVAIANVRLKGWGTAPVVVSDAYPTTVSNSLVGVAPTLTTTNAPYFDAGLSDAAGAAYSPKTGSTTMANLSTTINLDK